MEPFMVGLSLILGSLTIFLEFNAQLLYLLPTLFYISALSISCEAGYLFLHVHEDKGLN